jgi:hypothetical protein
MKEINYVRLKVMSEKLSSVEITQRIGIECDRFWEIGQLRAKTIIREKNNGWVIESRLGKTARLDAHVSDLLSRIADVTGKICELSMECEVEFSCVLYAASIPAVHFSKAVITDIYALGASLDIDLHVVPSTDVSVGGTCI